MSRASWTRTMFASVIGGCIGALVDHPYNWFSFTLIGLVALVGYVIAWGLK